MLAKDDLGALGVLVGFGWHKAIYSVLSPQVVSLPQSKSGHYLMRLDQFPKGGHETPYQKWEDNSLGCINGPSLKIYPHPDLSADRPSFEE